MKGGGDGGKLAPSFAGLSASALPGGVLAARAPLPWASILRPSLGVPETWANNPEAANALLRTFRLSVTERVVGLVVQPRRLLCWCSPRSGLEALDYSLMSPERGGGLYCDFCCAAKVADGMCAGVAKVETVMVCLSARPALIGFGRARLQTLYCSGRVTALGGRGSWTRHARSS